MERNTYIGSSDAPAILSNDWTQVYNEKVGVVEREDLSDNFKVQFGRHVEPFHLDWLIKVNPGWTWSKTQTNGEQHFASLEPEKGVIIGSHPDALLKLPDGLIVPVEVKHTGRFKTAVEAADYYMPQLQHHMLAWAMDVILVSVIYGNEPPDTCWIGASPEWQNHYIERCKRFWRHVAEKHPPSPPMHLDARKVVVPTEIKNTVPFDGMKRRDLSNSNSAMSLISEFNITKVAADRHAVVKDELKDLMAEDEREIYLPGIFEMKRDKRGAKRMKILDPQYGLAAE